MASLPQHAFVISGEHRLNVQNRRPKDKHANYLAARFGRDPDSHRVGAGDILAVSSLARDSDLPTSTWYDLPRCTPGRHLRTGTLLSRSLRPRSSPPVCGTSRTVASGLGNDLHGIGDRLF